MIRGRIPWKMAGACILFAAGLAFASSCDGQVVTAEYEISAVVRGAVLDEGNVGISGVTIWVRAYHDDQCNGPDWHEMTQPYVTQADGSFVADMFLPLVAPFRGCLVIRAEPPSTAGLEPDSVAGIFVDFVLGAATDTAVVNVILTSP